MNKESTTYTEYKIGHTTYMVKTIFNPDFQESLSDILKDLSFVNVKASSVKANRTVNCRQCKFLVQLYCNQQCSAL